MATGRHHEEKSVSTVYSTYLSASAPLLKVHGTVPDAEIRYEVWSPKMED